MPKSHIGVEADPDSALLLGLYGAMRRIRCIEEEIAERYSEQEMRCPVHLSIGQEAAAVGACAALRRTDQIVCSHRCHGHYLAKGGDLKAMLAEIYGKAAGCCGGRGGSMHLFDTEAGVLASGPIVASVIPIGVGVALAAKQRGEDTVCIDFLGDAAVEEGVFHESANFAAVHRLPVVFFVENNLYSVYTHLGDRQPDRPLADIAVAHGLPAGHADGNDVLAVLRITEDAVTRARTGGGPSLLVVDTYRWREHCGPNFDNDLGYRSPEEFEAWKTRCPIGRFAESLRREGRLTDREDQRIGHDIASEVEAAFTFAKEAPFPDPGSSAERVYAG